MSIFNQKSKFKLKNEIRTVRQPVERLPSIKKSSESRASSLDSSSSSRTKNNSKRPELLRSKPSSSSLLAAPDADIVRKRRRSGGPNGAGAGINSARSPSFVDSDTSGCEGEGGDDDDDWEAKLDARKRRKRAQSDRVDPNRRVRHPRLWTGGAEGGGEESSIIHAAHVASLKEKCQPVLGLARDEVGVRLQYPGLRIRERYELVWGNDKIDAVKDILTTVNFVASTYLTDDQARPFLDQNSGIHRRLEKSKNTNDGAGFKAALKEYNGELLALQRSGAIATNLDAMHGIPRELAAFILDQVYDRTVAPKVELLLKYKNGSDNVYGELLHDFISHIFDLTKLSSDMVFVDLGSGVGNVVLQAALEIGCESWGCEMMENACNLAEEQKKEFSARCRLWGIGPGKVYLERGDFRNNEKILTALKRADVVLVNNQAFTSQLNDNLVSMFLDLKLGCRIVSLKTFVHDNKIAENDVASSILDVTKHPYFENWVSWTSAGGTFCISTRK